jgi:hypothetical protein
MVSHPAASPDTRSRSLRDEGDTARAIIEREGAGEILVRNQREGGLLGLRYSGKNELGAFLGEAPDACESDQVTITVHSRRHKWSVGIADGTRIPHTLLVAEPVTVTESLGDDTVVADIEYDGIIEIPHPVAADKRLSDPLKLRIGVTGVIVALSKMATRRVLAMPSPSASKTPRAVTTIGELTWKSMPSVPAHCWFPG